MEWGAQLVFDYNATRAFLEGAVSQYEKTAPALADWLDEVYVALNEAPASVSVYELLQLQQLQMSGEWEHPNYAQNRWYKVRSLLGRDCGAYSF